MVTAMFGGGSSARIATLLFLYYNLGGGGLSVPVYVLLPALLAANLKPRRPALPERLADEAPAADPLPPVRPLAA